MNRSIELILDTKVRQQRTARVAAYQAYIEHRSVIVVRPEPDFTQDLIDIVNQSIGKISGIVLECFNDELAMTVDTELSALASEFEETGKALLSQEAASAKSELLEFQKKEKRVLTSPEKLQSKFGEIDDCVAIHTSRLRITIEQTKQERSSKFLQRQREDQRWWSDTLIKIFTFGLLIGTASISWLTFSSSRKEFRLRNRPILSYSVSSIPRFLADDAMRKNSHIGITVTNLGETPAYDAKIITAVRLYGRVLKSESDGGIEFDEHGTLFGKDISPIIIAPKGEITFSNEVSTRTLALMVGAPDDGKTDLIVAIHYTANWGDAKVSHFVTQEHFKPYSGFNNSFKIKISRQIEAERP